MIEQVYVDSFRKNIWKTNKDIANQGIKQVEVIKAMELRTMELIKLEVGKKVNGNNIKYERSRCIYDFQQFKMIKPFGGCTIASNINCQSSNKNICRSNRK